MTDDGTEIDAVRHEWPPALGDLPTFDDWQQNVSITNSTDAKP